MNRPVIDECDLSEESILDENESKTLNDRKVTASRPPLPNKEKSPIVAGKYHWVFNAHLDPSKGENWLPLTKDISD